MNRRKFIYNSLLTTTAVTGASLLNNCSTGIELKKVTILHTNDVHSHIDPFDKNNADFALKGGVSRRATVINNIRKNSKNTLPHAKFNFVSANYDFKNTILDGIVKPYQTFNKEGIKIGIFGLGVELNGMVTKNLYKETKYLDPIEITQQTVDTLKNNEMCDLIICLSHLGYEYKDYPSKISDVNLAKNTKDIDLIIGGHTHTFLKEPTPVKNINDEIVLVNQVGCHGLFLGKIDFYFHKNNLKKYKSASLEV